MWLAEPIYSTLGAGDVRVLQTCLAELYEQYSNSSSSLHFSWQTQIRPHARQAAHGGDDGADS